MRNLCVSWEHNNLNYLTLLALCMYSSRSSLISFLFLVWYIANCAEVILVYVFHSRASVLKSWNIVFFSVVNWAALNTSVHVGIEMLSKSYSWGRSSILWYCTGKVWLQDQSNYILLGACTLFSLTYTCLSRIQVFQSAGHLPGVDLSCWACNKNC